MQLAKNTTATKMQSHTHTQQIHTHTQYTHRVALHMQIEIIFFAKQREELSTLQRAGGQWSRQKCEGKGYIKNKKNSNHNMDSNMKPFEAEQQQQSQLQTAAELAKICSDNQ